MMGINAVKGVEIGAGFAVVNQRGSEHRDELTTKGFLSNNAGGVLGELAVSHHCRNRFADLIDSGARVHRHRW